MLGQKDMIGQEDYDKIGRILLDWKDTKTRTKDKDRKL